MACTWENCIFTTNLTVLNDSFHSSAQKKAAINYLINRMNTYLISKEKNTKNYIPSIQFQSITIPPKTQDLSCHVTKMTYIQSKNEPYSHSLENKPAKQPTCLRTLKFNTITAAFAS
jgi:hypothetical protein